MDPVRQLASSNEAADKVLMVAVCRCGALQWSQTANMLKKK